MESTYRPPFGSRDARVAGSLFVSRVSCATPDLRCNRLKCASPTSVRLKRELRVLTPVPRIWQRFPSSYIPWEEVSEPVSSEGFLRACDSTPLLNLNFIIQVLSAVNISCSILERHEDYYRKKYMCFKVRSRRPLQLRTDIPG